MCASYCPIRIHIPPHIHLECQLATHVLHRRDSRVWLLSPGEANASDFPPHRAHTCPMGCLKRRPFETTSTSLSLNNRSDTERRATPSTKSAGLMNRRGLSIMSDLSNLSMALRTWKWRDGTGRHVDKHLRRSSAVKISSAHTAQDAACTYH